LARRRSRAASVGGSETADQRVIVVELLTTREGSARLHAAFARGQRRFVLAELGGSVSVRATVSLKSEPPAIRKSQLGDLWIDWDVGTIERQDQQALLSWTERRLLACLIEHEGEAVSHRELIAAGWLREQATVSQNLLGVYVHYLRKRLASVGLVGAIRTVRGTGYCLMSTGGAESGVSVL
jgi:DNA-binding response OmpR family regulator